MVKTTLDAIVRDLLLVARFVASTPRGYGSHEAARARILLNRVDVEALNATLYGVIWLSESIYNQPMTYPEIQVYDAALRLRDLLDIIKKHHDEITRRLRAA